MLKVNASKPFLPVIENIIEKTQPDKIINIDFNIGAGIDCVESFLNKSIEVTSMLFRNSIPLKMVYIYLLISVSILNNKES